MNEDGLLDDIFHGVYMNIVGTIPSEIGDLSMLTDLQFGGNKLVGMA